MMSEPVVPESRNYVHQKCGEVTVVNGSSFSVVSNPLADVTRTWCTKCNTFFPMSEFNWDDSGERIVDYYERHLATASPMQRRICSKASLIAFVVVGAVLGISLGLFVAQRNAGLSGKIITSAAFAIVGLFAGAALHVSVITPYCVKKVCGVKDTRTLV